MGRRYPSLTIRPAAARECGDGAPRKTPAPMATQTDPRFSAACALTLTACALPWPGLGAITERHAGIDPLYCINEAGFRRATLERPRQGRRCPLTRWVR